MCIFEGIMTAPLYCDILEGTILPFIQQKFPSPNSHRFMPKNDPHTSRVAKEFFTTNNINWWCTLPESPDMNPIENFWHELKEYIRREVKPVNKEQLVNGITRFWASIDAHKCSRYIDHLKKFYPKSLRKMVMLQGTKHYNELVNRPIELYNTMHN